MIIQRLYEYAVNHPDIIPSPGWGMEKIEYAIVLDEKGEIVQIQHLGGILLKVPSLNKKRTVGIEPNFLWDNTQYVFGFWNEFEIEKEIEKENKRGKSLTKDDFNSEIEKIKKNALERFEKFKEFNLKRLENIPSLNTELLAFQKFMEKLSPIKTWEEIVNFLKQYQCDDGFVEAKVVFRFKDQESYIHESEQAKQIWENYIAEQDAQKGMCLVTGKNGTLARTHPQFPLKGGQASGTSLVSFNKNAFTSYNWKQAYNAPVSQEVAARYVETLKYFDKNGRNSTTLGNTTVFFWADEPDEGEDVFGFVVSGRARESGNEATIRNLLENIRQGKGFYSSENLNKRFYLLGMVPNNSRASVRFWYESNVSDLIQKLHQYLQDMSLENTEHNFFSVYAYMLDTVSKNISDKEDAMHPRLAEIFLSAIVKNEAFPTLLPKLVLNALRHDHNITQPRVNMLKGFLIRYYRKNYQKEVRMSIDCENQEIGYVLGRVFAILEKIQQDALGSELNATIVDRFFVSASTTPASVFSYLVRLSNHHLSKLKKENPRLAHTRSIQLQEAMGRIVGFPKHLNMIQQSWFVLGYYHQKQSFSTKQNVENNG